ncbi:MAG TPA: hypothetical protein PKA63_03210 [Oligoflexia bacterium]|nr:hypothetical protein [Oligoflexia bacterium]
MSNSKSYLLWCRIKDGFRRKIDHGWEKKGCQCPESNSSAVRAMGVAGSYSNLPPRRAI